MVPVPWLVIVAALCLTGGFGADALAAPAARLWSQRPAGSAPLTQVPDFRTLATQVIPAVVSIQVEQRVKSQAPWAQGDPLDLFHRYFAPDAPHTDHAHGLGSGFVIDASGLLLTNFHVVEDAEAIAVTFEAANGSERVVSARVLGTAPEYDVALLQTADTGQADIAYLGDSESTQIGDWVMAVGNPFGLAHSVSVGIISAKQRRGITPSGRHGLYNFLQTDASINPGNSGGPLINMRGEVIGINSAVNASGSGIGFAIPINMVKEILPELKSKGRYTRSWMGIKIQPLTADLAQSFGLNKTGGALVTDVLAKSPAAVAKLREGDIITQFDGKELRSSTDLPLFSSIAGVGRAVPLKIWRERHELDLSVKLTEFPGDTPAESPEAPPTGGELGLLVADITPYLQQQLGIESNRGVVIKDVDAAGLAARAGCRAGDVIVSLNGQEVSGARAFAEGVRGTAHGELMRLKVRREALTQFLALRKP